MVCVMESEKWCVIDCDDFSATVDRLLDWGIGAMQDVAVMQIVHCMHTYNNISHTHTCIYSWSCTLTLESLCSNSRGLVAYKYKIWYHTYIPILFYITCEPFNNDTAEWMACQPILYESISFTPLVFLISQSVLLQPRSHSWAYDNLRVMRSYKRLIVAYCNF